WSLRKACAIPDNVDIFISGDLMERIQHNSSMDIFLHNKGVENLVRANARRPNNHVAFLFLMVIINHFFSDLSNISLIHDMDSVIREPLLYITADAIRH